MPNNKPDVRLMTFEPVYLHKDVADWLKSHPSQAAVLRDCLTQAYNEYAAHRQGWLPQNRQ